MAKFHFRKFGCHERKLNRFSNILVKAFQNSAVYQINHNAQLVKKLKDAHYFLVYSGNTFESSGVYMFAAPELLGCDNDTILRILRNKSIGCDLVPKLDIGNNLNVYDITTKETDLNILVSKGGFQRNSLLPSSSKFVK